MRPPSVQVSKAQLVTHPYNLTLVRLSYSPDTIVMHFAETVIATHGIARRWKGFRLAAS